MILTVEWGDHVRGSPDQRPAYLAKRGRSSIVSSQVLTGDFGVGMANFLTFNVYRKQFLGRLWNWLEFDYLKLHTMTLTVFNKSWQKGWTVSCMSVAFITVNNARYEMIRTLISLRIGMRNRFEDKSPLNLTHTEVYRNSFLLCGITSTILGDCKESFYTKSYFIVLRNIIARRGNSMRGQKIANRICMLG